MKENIFYTHSILISILWEREHKICPAKRMRERKLSKADRPHDGFYFPGARVAEICHSFAQATARTSDAAGSWKNNKNLIM